MWRDVESYAEKVDDPTSQQHNLHAIFVGGWQLESVKPQNVAITSEAPVIDRYRVMYVSSSSSAVGGRM